MKILALVIAIYAPVMLLIHLSTGKILRAWSEQPASWISRWFPARRALRTEALFWLLAVSAAAVAVVVFGHVDDGYALFVYPPYRVEISLLFFAVLVLAAFAVLYGLVRATILFFAVVAFIGIHLPHAHYGAALALLAIASLSFMGIGIMTSVLPLISPEKGAQLGFVAQGMLLVVSGVYYPIEVLPGWMQGAGRVSPATYVLEGMRATVLNGTSTGQLGMYLLPMAIIGALTIPMGMGVFTIVERYAKRTGRLKRSG